MSFNFGRLYGLRGWTLIGILSFVLFVVFPILSLKTSPDSSLHLSQYWVTLIGKIMCYAIVAIAMDLIWGYAGILSLGHGLFFALGGYAMGMYLMRQIGREGQYQSDLPDFMVFLDWKELPWHWWNSDQFWWCALLVVLVPGLLALRVRLLRLPLARQGRVLLDHHAGADLRRDAAVLPQRHRLRRQQRLHRLQAHPRHSRSPTPGDADGAVCDHGRRRSSLTLLLGALHRHLQVRPRADRDPRRRDARARSAATTRCTTSSPSGRSRRCSAASPARSTCRRSASSTRARCRPPIRSRSRSGSRSAGAARSSARSSAPAW